jgi:hypothetical protein
LEGQQGFFFIFFPNGVDDNQKCSLLLHHSDSGSRCFFKLTMDGECSPQLEARRLGSGMGAAWSSNIEDDAVVCTVEVLKLQFARVSNASE